VKVIVSAAADSDLAAIGDWIADDNPERALSFIEELRAKVAELAMTPRLYPYAQGLENRSIRRRLYRGYLIFYEIANDRIEIIHIVHSMRDYAALFGQDDQTNE
jgi:toxin ParE1/3/4